MEKKKEEEKNMQKFILFLKVGAKFHRAVIMHRNTEIYRADDSYSEHREILIFAKYVEAMQ